MIGSERFPGVAMPKVSHFEIGADDPERAMSFYKKVFGWKFEEYGGQNNYWLATAGEKEENGINGAIQPRTGFGSSVVNTITVKDIDETTRDIEENGGTVVVPMMEIPKIGKLIYFKDTEENVFGAIQPDPSMMQM
jgi:uncharacterized protein